ncbi:unnamed protein product [Brassica oleracea var. botrytis]|uniref:(rape) hypothetical protein n=1 Tax=Brassica napus TaxID=3708 RepID=A0A816J9H8_BRANA|nr:unnamed protein product [Brassica napus]
MQDVMKKHISYNSSQLLAFQLITRRLSIQLMYHYNRITISKNVCGRITIIEKPYVAE